MSNSLICIHENGYIVAAVLLHFPYAKTTESFQLDAKWIFTVSLTYDGSSAKRAVNDSANVISLLPNHIPLCLSNYLDS